MNEQRIEMIRERLLDALEPEMLEIEDESHLHAGHAGARDGRGHFRVTLVSEAFSGHSPIRRHRLVYAALGGLMETDIHALTIQAYAPGEV
ncbi:MAG TPA: BolA family protein [Gammaproteobacteria bacterium]|nr:BolA family protein [Gammaproteobacteria bacterium]HRP87159.1 BolA family protein [Gammaproteobacteria bacterium]